MPPNSASRPHLEAWLKRTRRLLSESGRLTQVAHVLSRERGGTETEWSGRLRVMMLGGGVPALELLTHIDTILAGKPGPLPSTDTQEELW